MSRVFFHSVSAEAKFGYMPCDPTASASAPYTSHHPTTSCKTAMTNTTTSHMSEIAGHLSAVGSYESARSVCAITAERDCLQWIACILLVIIMCACAGTAQAAEDELWSWAQHLSGRTSDRHSPSVERVSHSWLVEHACSGECRVAGWYPGHGDIIYVDERLDLTQITAASIIVHEMVHVLQETSGAFNCTAALAMEREAYGVQREFLLRYGIYYPVGSGLLRGVCR